jgi:hypothetical protein
MTHSRWDGVIADNLPKYHLSGDDGLSRAANASPEGLQFPGYQAGGPARGRLMHRAVGLLQRIRRSDTPSRQGVCLFTCRTLQVSYNPRNFIAMVTLGTWDEPIDWTQAGS